MTDPRRFRRLFEIYQRRALDEMLRLAMSGQRLGVLRSNEAGRRWWLEQMKRPPFLKDVDDPDVQALLRALEKN